MASIDISSCSDIITVWFSAIFRSIRKLQKSRFLGAESATYERATELILVSFDAVFPSKKNNTKIVSVALSYVSDSAPKKRHFSTSWYLLMPKFIWKICLVLVILYGRNVNLPITILLRAQRYQPTIPNNRDWVSPHFHFISTKMRQGQLTHPQWVRIGTRRSWPPTFRILSFSGVNTRRL